jgi:hypothetical protein
LVIILVIIFFVLRMFIRTNLDRRLELKERIEYLLVGITLLAPSPIPPKASGFEVGLPSRAALFL